MMMDQKRLNDGSFECSRNNLAFLKPFMVVVGITVLCSATSKHSPILDCDKTFPGICFCQ